MGVVKSKSGDLVTLGAFTGGYPTLTTWGKGISAADAGVPLLNYSPLPTDPLTIWKTQPAVRKVVGFAARQFASIPWKAYQQVDDTDRRHKRKSPAETIMRNPMPMVTGYMFWEQLITDRLLYDNCLAVLAGDVLVRVPPRLIRVLSDQLGVPREIWMAAPGDMDDINLTDAPKISTWGWHSDRAGGVSPMMTLSAILDESARAVAWRAKQWENGPKINGYLQRPPEARTWKTDERERFMKAWATWKTQEKAGGTPVLENGMDYKQLTTMAPKDAQDIEGRQLTDIEVANAFFIPPELIGAREGKFASIEAWRQMLFGPTLGPLATEMKQAVNSGGIVQAMDTTPDLYLEPDRDEVADGSFLEKARTLQILTGGPVMSRAEARTRLNLPHMEGTDDLVLPLNVTIGGLASPTDTGNQNVEIDNQEREDQNQ